MPSPRPELPGNSSVPVNAKTDPRLSKIWSIIFSLVGKFLNQGVRQS